VIILGLKSSNGEERRKLKIFRCGGEARLEVVPPECSWVIPEQDQVSKQLTALPSRYGTSVIFTYIWSDSVEGRVTDARIPTNTQRLEIEIQLFLYAFAKYRLSINADVCLARICVNFLKLLDEAWALFQNNFESAFMLLERKLTILHDIGGATVVPLSERKAQQPRSGPCLRDPR